MVFILSCLPKINDGVYMINPNGCESIGTYWIAIFIKNDLTTYLITLELYIFQQKLKSL